MTMTASLDIFKKPKTLYLGAFLLASTILATGCASTAKGAKQSSMMGLVQSQPLKTQVPAGSVFAVIRYPAVVETAAKDAYYKAFENSVLGGSVSQSSDCLLYTSPSPRD